MKKLALVLSLAGLSLAAHAQSAYETWDDVKPAAVRVAPAVSAAVPKLPVAGKAVSASYVGTAHATYAFTAPYPQTESFPSYATYSGQASATGVASFKATATSKGASFTGTLSKWVADPNSAKQLPGFNKRAVGILSNTVSLSGKIGDKSTTVSGSQQKTLAGAGSTTASSTSAVGSRSKDYLPNTLDGTITLRNAKDYRAGSKRQRTEVNYQWSTVRK